MAAKLQLLKVKPRIIGIAGSSGKSSLSRMLGNMLTDAFSVKQSEGKNSETGIPLDILGIHMKDFSSLAWLVALVMVPVKLLIDWKKYDIYVAEMGIDSPVEPKNMSYLLKIIQPSIGIVTNVSLEHSEFFEPFVNEINPDEKQKKILALTAEQETLLLTSLSKEGTAIVNLDDLSIAAMRDRILSQRITISLKSDADLVAKDYNSSLSRFSMVIQYQGKNYPLTINQPLPKHFAYEFLCALGAAIALEVPLENAITSLQKNFSLPAGRLTFFKGINDTTIIDSTYNNATLPPILDILDFMGDIAGTRRKVVILGDMRELGEEAQDIHAAVAQKLMTIVDFAILIGPLSEKYMVPILRQAKFPFENFPDVTSSKDAILGLIKPQDIILVKGSQNTLFLERIVEMLLEDKKDVEKLTRRGAFWDKKRSETS